MKFLYYNKWSQLPTRVNILFDLSSNETMFITREWFEALYSTAFDDEPSLLLACVVDKDIVLALLPLINATEHLKSFRHSYTALYSLLLAEEKQTEILACLAEGLSKSSIQSLDLRPIAENNSNLLMLQNAMEIAGYESHRHFLFYNWFHETQQQSFAEYMSDRPSMLRNTIERKHRKLEREQKITIRMFRGDEVKLGLKDYHDAYSSSWKANEQSSSLLDATAINLATPDWTRLAILYINGDAAAAQLWFVVKDKASIFRLAYNETWKRYSPGSILTAYLMEHVIDIDKVSEIDFLTGNEPYKQDWMSARRQRFSLVFVKKHTSTKNKLSVTFKRLLSYIHHLTRFIEGANVDKK